MAEQKRPGRPRTGNPVKIRLPEDLQSLVKAAARPREPFAATVRRLLREALSQR